MKLTHASTYAVYALADMAQHGNGGLIASHLVAERQHIPARFTLKVLKSLASAGILRSVRGPHGGYRLAKPAEKISLLEVIEAVEGPIRGQAPFTEGHGTGGLDTRLQTICDRAAEQLRQRLGRVKLAELTARKANGR